MGFIESTISHINLYKAIKQLFIDGEFYLLYEIITSKKINMNQLYCEIEAYFETLEACRLDLIITKLLKKYKSGGKFESFTEDIVTLISKQQISLESPKLFKKSLVNILKIFKEQSNIAYVGFNQEWLNFDTALVIFMLSTEVFLETPVLLRNKDYIINASNSNLEDEFTDDEEYINPYRPNIDTEMYFSLYEMGLIDENDEVYQHIDENTHIEDNHIEEIEKIEQFFDDESHSSLDIERNRQKELNQIREIFLETYFLTFRTGYKFFEMALGLQIY